MFLCFNHERNYSEGKKPEESYKDISTLTKAACTFDLVSLFRIFLAWRKVREWLIVETNLVHTKLYFYPRKNQYVRSRRDGWCTFFMILFKEPKTPTDHVRLMHKLETLDQHWASSSKLYIQGIAWAVDSEVRNQNLWFSTSPLPVHLLQKFQVLGSRIQFHIELRGCFWKHKRHKTTKLKWWPKTHQKWLKWHGQSHKHWGIMSILTQWKQILFSFFLS